MKDDSFQKKFNNYKDNDVLRQAHDESRDAALRSLNFKVLRFSARDVRETPALITNKILENII